jgi:hypothetical protein
MEKVLALKFGLEVYSATDLAYDFWP